MPVPARAVRYDALDGLRTVAIALVIVDHCHVPHLSGGLLGVDVFFVISGFVITLTLLREDDRTRQVNLAAFYLRRLFRLMPALVCMIVFGFVIEVGFGGPRVSAGGYLDQAAEAITYTYNLFQAIHHGAGLDLSHTWSLGVEEQFYIVWAPLLAFILARAAGTRRVFAALLATLVFYASQVVTVSALGTIPAFYLPWSRFDELLVGAVVALAIHGHAVNPLTRVLASRVFGVGAAVALGVLIAVSRSYSSGLLYGGFLGVAVLCGLIIGHLYLTNGARAPLTVALSRGPMVWLGRRSYGIYLYHAPILIPYELHEGIGHWQVSLLITAVGATLVAAISYRFVEVPIMRAGHAWIHRRFPTQPVTAGR